MWDTIDNFKRIQHKIDQFGAFNFRIFHVPTVKSEPGERNVNIWQFKYCSIFANDELQFTSIGRAPAVKEFETRLHVEATSTNLKTTIKRHVFMKIVNTCKTDGRSLFSFAVSTTEF